MMTLRRILSGAVCASAVLTAAPAFATTINFDSLADGAVVTNQYPGVLFSSDPGFEMQITAQSLGSSLPNFICTGPVGGSIDCAHSVFVDFAAGVDGLNFLAIGSNNAGAVAQINIFTGGVFDSTVDLTSNGNPLTPQAVDLSAFSNVTRIEIVNDIDAAGLGYDDFNFTGGVSSGAPEPATWAMMLMGFGGLGALLRRRRPLAA